MWRAMMIAIALVLVSLFGSQAVGPASAYEVAEVVHGASVSGRVTFEGTPPPPKRFQVEKNPEVCGHERGLEEVAVRDGFLKGAVIVLEGVEKGKPFATRAYRAEPPGGGAFHYAPGDALGLEIRTKTCSFGPYTGVIAPETPIGFLNQDPMKHTIQTFVVRGRRSNIFRTIHNRDARPDSPFEKRFTAEQLDDSRVVKLICNRHDFMQNWFYTVQTPYFAISDENGSFTIDQVPPGRYQLVAWHPELGRLTREISLAEGGTIEEHFEFSAD